MLASTVFKKIKGTGSAYNKALKTTPFGRSDAFTRGGFAIMPHATAPLSLMLEGVSLNCTLLYKISVQPPSPAVSKIALAFGGFHFAASTS